MRKAKDSNGQVLHPRDKVSYDGSVWVVDRVAGTQLYLSFSGAFVTVDSSKVKKVK